MVKNLLECEAGKWYVCTGPTITKVVKVVNVMGRHRFKGIICSPLAGPGIEMKFDEDAKAFDDGFPLVEGKSINLVTGWYDHIFGRLKEALTAEKVRVYSSSDCVLAIGLERDAGDMVATLLASKVGETDLTLKFAMVPADKLNQYIRKDKAEIILEPTAAAVYSSGRLVIPDKDHKGTTPTAEIISRLLEFV